LNFIPTLFLGTGSGYDCTVRGAGLYGGLDWRSRSGRRGSMWRH